MEVITVRFLGPTNCRGSRLKATHTSGQSLTVPRQYNLSEDEDFYSAAYRFCLKIGWRGKLVGGWQTPAVKVFVMEEA